MSRSGKGKAVDRSAQRSYQEDDHSDNDDYEDDDDDWKSLEDPGERRRIQNKLAQRKFREKTRIAREESMRHSQNQAAARNAYSHPDPRDLQHGNASSGLPWGGVSIRHVVERGKEREQQSARRSREGSVAYDSRGGGVGVGVGIGGGGGGGGTGGVRGADRGGSVNYNGSGRGGRGESYSSYYGSARGGGGGGGGDGARAGGGGGGGDSAGTASGRGTTTTKSASDRAYYAASRGKSSDYPR